MNNIFLQLIKTKIEQFENDYINLSRQIFVDSSGKIIHPGEFGTYREKIIRNFLKPFLPTRLDIGNGFIITSKDRISSQCDIIIYDKEYTPIIENGEQKFFPVECVVGVIEAKSKLTKSTLRDALIKLSKIKDLRNDIDNNPYIFKNYSGDSAFNPKLKVRDQMATFLICESIEMDIEKEINSVFSDIYKEIDKSLFHNMILNIDAGFTKEFFGKEEVAEWIDELNATEITHNFTLEPGVWMAPVVLENKDGSAVLGRRIHFDRMLNFYVTDLFEGLAAGHYSWQCGICHRFFFMETAHKQLYCSTVNPEYGVPCAYVAKNKLNMPKQKKKDGFGYAIWKKRYDSLRNEKHKTNKNLPSAKYDVDVCDKAIELAKRHYEEAQIDFDYAQNQYERDMVLINLIAEAKAALGKK